MRTSSDFAEIRAVHSALQFALKGGIYSKEPLARRAAERLLKELEGDRSVYGRQLKMVGLIRRGVTVAQLGKKLKCSRRTVFRYLNSLEDAGVSIELRENKYYVTSGGYSPAA